jgi:hypothetical protein
MTLNLSGIDFYRRLESQKIEGSLALATWH